MVEPLVWVLSCSLLVYLILICALLLAPSSAHNTVFYDRVVVELSY